MAVAATVRPRAGVWAVFATAAAVATVGFAPLALGDVDYNRARLAIWASLLLATPALAFLLLGGGRVTWRPWWTVAYALFLLHLHWGFGRIFAGDAGAVLAVQGRVVGSSNFVLTAVWGGSVVAAWVSPRLAWLHWLAAVLLVVSGLVSTLVFGHGPSRPVGGLMLLAVLGAGAARAIGR